MKKLVKLFTLFLMAVFLSFCKLNQTYAPPDIIRSTAKDSVSFYGPTQMVRNVKQARNGDILIASYTGVWRYDARLPARAGWDGNDGVGQGKTITDFKSASGQQ